MAHIVNSGNAQGRTYLRPSSSLSRRQESVIMPVTNARVEPVPTVGAMSLLGSARNVQKVATTGHIRCASSSTARKSS